MSETKTVEQKLDELLQREYEADIKKYKRPQVKPCRRCQNSEQYGQLFGLCLTCINIVEKAIIQFNPKLYEAMITQLDKY